MLRPIDDRACAIIAQSDALIPGKGIGTGWRPEPASEKDFKLKALLGSDAPPAKAGIARSHVPPVRDQGTQGACTGFGTANAVGTLLRKATSYATIYSPQFIYNLARTAIGELHLDGGAYIRDAVGAVRKIGAAKERDFPYYELQDVQFVPPPSRAFESARAWRLGAHYRCETLNDMKRAIASGYPVVYGFLCYANLGQAEETGVIPEPAGSMTGGHCVIATEYDDATRLLSGPNSWGRAWGRGQGAAAGWIHLPYSFSETGKLNDAWALVDEAPETVGKLGPLVTG